MVILPLGGRCVVKNKLICHSRNSIRERKNEREIEMHFPCVDRAWNWKYSFRISIYKLSSSPGNVFNGWLNSCSLFELVPSSPARHEHHGRLFEM